ncbi:MAG: Uma2 family endonuclease [Bilifractor sp.]
MTIEDMQKRKMELHYTYSDLAALSGLPISTVQKVLGGITKSPRYDTLQALERVLRTSDKSELYKGVNYTSSSKADRISEEAFSYLTENQYKKEASAKLPWWARNPKYPRQGNYTLKDYLALPENQRAELIDGVIYDMASPLTIHQAILMEVAVLLRFMQEKHSGCHVFSSPMDVQLDCDDRTILEPDIFVVCDQKKITKRRIVGAPDLVIEILSQSSRNKDIQVKTDKYGRAGVREYWLIDPDKRSILVIDFEHNTDIHFYSFEDQVPIGISNGEEEIDFCKIQKAISYLDEQ